MYIKSASKIYLVVSTNFYFIKINIIIKKLNDQYISKTQCCTIFCRYLRSLGGELALFPLFSLVLFRTESY